MRIDGSRVPDWFDPPDDPLKLGECRFVELSDDHDGATWRRDGKWVGASLPQNK